MTIRTSSEAADRYADVQQCEKELADAEQNLQVARDELDSALARRHWTRVPVVTNPGAVGVYESILHPGAVVALPQVLAAVLAEDLR